MEDLDMSKKLSNLQVDMEVVPEYRDPCRTLLCAYMERVLRDLKSRNDCDWPWTKDAIRWVRGRRIDPDAFSFEQVAEELKFTARQCALIIKLVEAAEAYVNQRQKERKSSRIAERERLARIGSKISAPYTAVLWPSRYIRRTGT